MLVYRLGSSRYPANDGLGASLYGGRWNHKGTPVIYTAASRALCALEVLSNENGLADDYVITPIQFPDDVPATKLRVEDLPLGWGEPQSLAATARIGTHWAMGLDTVMLCVPSAVIPQELNYLLNPRHPDFGKIRFLDPEQFRFDDRLRHTWETRRAP